MRNNISLCPKCNCMTHKVCGKCAIQSERQRILDLPVMKMETNWSDNYGYHNVPSDEQITRNQLRQEIIDSIKK